jgi:hydrogenase maturation protease
LPVGVDAIARHVLTAELVTELVGRERAIFLDAAAGGEPGTVQVHRLEPDVDAHSTMAHFLDPSELLAWCQRLYGQAPEAYLITVTGDCFDYAHCQLSPVVEAALERLLEQVERLWKRRRLSFMAGQMAVPEDFDQMGKTEMARLFGLDDN